MDIQNSFLSLSISKQLLIFYVVLLTLQSRISQVVSMETVEGKIRTEWKGYTMIN